MTLIRQAALYGLILISLACQSTQQSLKAQLSASERLHQFFERAFQDELQRSPQRMSYLGMKQDYDRLDDKSEAKALADLELTKAQLAELKTFPYEELDPQAQLSYRLFERRAQSRIDEFRFRRHSFPVNQMFGAQSEFPSFMINIHRVSNEEDARAYIARLRAVRQHFAQVREELGIRAQMGIIAPRFVFSKVLSDSRNVISGQPFDQSGRPSALLEDFDLKLKALTIPEERKKELRLEAIAALQESVRPAYEELIQSLVQLEKKASDQVGAWSLPEGEAYYRNRLQQITTTDLTPDAIHQIGLKEVDRILKEMDALQRRVGFKGSRQQFFAFLQKDPRFYYPPTAQGRAQYLADTQSRIDAMQQRLSELFITLPRDKLQVKAVEAFREKSAGLAFYNSPAADGSRPGIYYVNLSDMKLVPKYEQEALAYHEGVPGHHLQLSISQQLDELPKFRRFGGYTVYSEGWGLYSEAIAKEIGFYQDPYSDFGRLSMELWRACRLVVDTGIHAKRWTRAEAIAYLSKTTPANQGEIVKSVERYIVMPGQATAYKIGMLKIQELRAKAEASLGSAFDIRRFHEEVLKNGPLPLDLLETQIANWASPQVAGF